MQSVIRWHPFYFSAGRKKLFREADLIAITAALRPEPLPLPKPAYRPPFPFAGRISPEPLAEAQRLLAKGRKKGRRGEPETP